MNFAEALRYLLGLGHETLTIKLGLENTQLLLQELGNPQRSFPAVQIAGTNGKGSTAVLLDNICRAAGIRCGLFTSPHLIFITERIRIGGIMISPHDFARFVTDVRDAAEKLVQAAVLPALPTFFEQITATTFLAFAEAKLELAILETGLGGRLDATTVAQAETIALTSIALEHEALLGHTIGEIASEKAAIIRPGVIAVIAKQEHEALEVILRRCNECGVNPFIDDCRVRIDGTTTDGRFRVAMQSPKDTYEITLGLRGRHQITNAAVALRLAESLREKGFQLPRPAIIEGLETADHPGRLELIVGSPSILLDGAHNPSGAKTLRQYLDEFVSGPITLVFGVMNDKNVSEIAKILFPAVQQVVFTQPNNPRALPPDQLERVASELGQVKVMCAGRVESAFQSALDLTPDNGLVCVAGSLYLVGEIREFIDTCLVKTSTISNFAKQ